MTIYGAIKWKKGTLLSEYQDDDLELLVEEAKDCILIAMTRIPDQLIIPERYLAWTFAGDAPFEECDIYVDDEHVFAGVNALDNFIWYMNSQRG